MQRALVGLLGIGLLLGLAACAPAPPEPIEVQVTLNEFGIESTMTSFKVGQPYHLVINNAGGLNHELMIMAPLMSDTEMSMEEMDEIALAMVEEDDLAPGSTMTLDITFTDSDANSNLEFACHVTGHYEAGMKLPVTVEQ